MCLALIVGASACTTFRSRPIPPAGGAPRGDLRVTVRSGETFTVRDAFVARDTLFGTRIVRPLSVTAAAVRPVAVPRAEVRWVEERRVASTRTTLLASVLGALALLYLTLNYTTI